MVSVLLCLIIVFVFPMSAVATEIAGSSFDNIDEVQLFVESVGELYAERSFLRMKKNSISSRDAAVMSIDTIDEKIKEVDQKLEALGVRFTVSPETLEKQNSSIRSGLSETWSEVVKDSVYSQGVRYELTILTAESADTSSILYNSSSKTIHAAPGLAAGTADYARIYGTAMSGVVGTVFGTIYDAVNTTLSNLSTSTVIENVSATYNWQCDTLMHYIYVKRYGTNEQPLLCYAYNEVNTLVLGVTANVKFGQTDYPGNKLNYDVYELRSRRIRDDSARTNSLGNAINCYLNYSGVKHSFVSSVTIMGAGGNRVIKEYVCQEPYPGLVY